MIKIAKFSLGIIFAIGAISCAPAQPPEIIHPFIGCWESEDGRSTEYWQHDRSGWMVGYSRNFDKDGNVSFFEHMRIEAGDNGERLVVSGMADAPVAFERVATDNPNQFRFENADHDFPQVISYEPSDGRLDAWISALDGTGRVEFKKHACRN